LLLEVDVRDLVFIVLDATPVLFFLVDAQFFTFPLFLLSLYLAATLPFSIQDFSNSHQLFFVFPDSFCFLHLSISDFAVQYTLYFYALPQLLLF
jgi:hypothetical protein